MMNHRWKKNYNGPIKVKCLYGRRKYNNFFLWMMNVLNFDIDKLKIFFKKKGNLMHFFWTMRFYKTDSDSLVRIILDYSIQFFQLYSEFDSLVVLKGWPDQIQLRFLDQPIESDSSVWFLKHWIIGSCKLARFWLSSLYIFFKELVFEC